MYQLQYLKEVKKELCINLNVDIEKGWEMVDWYVERKKEIIDYTQEYKDFLYEAA